MINELTNKADIQQGKVLVDFYAPWCNPCKQLMPIVEAVAAEVTDVKVLKVNVDAAENKEFVAELGLMGVPALIAFKDGEAVQRMAGFQPKERIIAMINSI